MVREFSNATLNTVVLGRMRVHLPPLGNLSIALANAIVILVLCFYKLNTRDEWSWETIGYRTGFIAIAQLPLIFLLAAKSNIIGFLTGSSHERLNWLHRWTARTLWLTATIHMCFWFRSWGRYNYILRKLQTDPLTQTGFSSWCVLTLIVILSAAPVRRLSYELFVLSHILTFCGFIAAVWFHAPAEVKAWVWIPIGLLAFDRLVRYAFMLLINARLLAQRSKATFTPLPGNVTRISIPGPPFSWQPGQHAFLSCHSVLPLQSHPFTISSIPSDRRLEFLVRAEKGGTKKLFKHASAHSTPLGQTGSQSEASSAKVTILDGPYGRIRPLRQFDSVVLIAGGIGATFTMPLLRDIVQGWKNEFFELKRAKSKSAFRTSFSLTKRVRFIWVIRSRSHLAWFAEQLERLMGDIDDCAEASSLFSQTRKLEISVYVTCDSELNLEPSTSLPEKEEQQTAKTSASVEVTDITAMTEKHTHLPLRNSCCCTETVTDETAPRPQCICSRYSATSFGAESQERSRLYSTSSSQPSLDQRIPILSGRPDTLTIIRSVLEKAEGESSVVVCGPRSLNFDVRRNVVSLSDERAVHRGTGAQGIYMHVEEFGF